MHGNLLHFRHPVPFLLVGGHKAPGPGGGILDKGPGKGNAALIGIANGVGGAGIGHPADIIDILGHPFLPVGLGQAHPVAVAHDLHVHALIVGVWVAVIGPQKGADLHLFFRRQEGLPTTLRDLHHFCRTQLIGVMVAHLLVGKGLKGHTAALVILSHMNGQTAKFIPASDEAVRRHN